MTNQSDPYIIALMGVTGAGKSTFIDVVTGQNGQGVGHSLKSATAKVVTTPYTDAKGRSFIFVDTPGFDDTTQPDTVILRLIADWLKETYDKKKHLTGIIYCHRITDNRMPGAALKNLTMFGKLCGDRAAERVIMMSTMWDYVPRAVGDHERREEELRNTFWKPMIDFGCKVDRFDKSYATGWRIIDLLTKLDSERTSTSDELLLQEEMAVLRKHLSETAAGAALYNTLQSVLAMQKEGLRRLRDAEQDDPKARAILDKEYRKAEAELEKTFEQVKELKVPFSRKVAALFHRKKPHANAVDINIKPE